MQVYVEVIWHDEFYQAERIRFTPAFNDAVRKAEATSQEKMAGFTAGLNLPPGMKLPF